MSATVAPDAAAAAQLPNDLIKPWHAIADVETVVELPKSAYTLGFAIFLIQETAEQSNSCVERCFEWWGTLMQCFFTLIIHFIILSFLTYYLVTLDYEERTAESPDFLLLASCTCVFTAFMLGEMFESWTMIKWLYCAPSAPRLIELRLKFNEEKKPNLPLNIKQAEATKVI